MATRREVVAAIRERYGAATREEKGRILDELVAVASYHRKHAIRVLIGRKGERAVAPGRRGRRQRLCRVAASRPITDRSETRGTGTTVRLDTKRAVTD
jgi:hypothetical protein